MINQPAAVETGLDRYVTLGGSGLRFSPVCFGTWQLSPRFWGEQPKAQVMDAMRIRDATGKTK